MNRFIRSLKGILTVIVVSALALLILAHVVVPLVFISLTTREADLLEAFERETGLKLPDNARVVSYRRPPDFFGNSGGMFRAKVACDEIGRLKNMSGTIFGNQDQFEVLRAKVAPMFDVWRASRFTIPAGASVVEYDQFNLEPWDDFFEVKAIYAVDGNNCTVYYHRDDTG
ncbi:MAG: hypothetical protein AAF572_24470 [Cyanobacteria bacterium P01_B01_bin.77]